MCENELYVQVFIHACLNGFLGPGVIESSYRKKRGNLKKKTFSLSSVRKILLLAD